MKISVYILNAFAKTPNGGNPAGVVLGAENLSDGQMQDIAKEVNLTETAFVQASDKADFKLRFFTTNQEVNLCGHATVAAISLMVEKEMLEEGKYKQETKAGVLDVEVQSDGVVFMAQVLPRFSEEISKEKIKAALNLKDSDLMDLPIEIVSTGFPTIIVPVVSKQVLENMEPFLDKCIEICDGKYLLNPFTFETKGKGSAAYSRNFFPVKTLDEEAATGTSSAALACYLFKHKQLKGMDLKRLRFEQGYFLNKPSEILVRLETKEQNVTKVMLGGASNFVEEKEVEC